MADLRDLHDRLTANLPSSLPQDATTGYITHLTNLPLSDLSTTEVETLNATSTQLTRSIQSLAKRSHRQISKSAISLAHLSKELPALIEQSQSLADALPQLDSKAAAFADKYRKSAENSNPKLIARKSTLLLARNADRITNILELPTLLASAVSSSSATSSTSTSTQSTASNSASSANTSATVNYSSALDLHAHIRRLAALYPASPLVASLSVQAERQMQALASALITGLRAPNLKLASAMRSIGWMRRVAPELDTTLDKSAGDSGEGVIGALFLSCRLHALVGLLDALDPLKELAEGERLDKARRTKEKELEKKGEKKVRRRGDSNAHNQATLGTQTERYLKRYIEIFREQSFSIISTYTSIFPSATSFSTSSVPSPLTTFTSHLVDMLFSTLRTYLPVVGDTTSRDSLMTQVLYCAGSLGRLGGDFSIMIGVLEEELAEETDSISQEEWVRVVKKHRVQASRLELLASGVGTIKREGTTA